MLQDRTACRRPIGGANLGWLYLSKFRIQCWYLSTTSLAKLRDLVEAWWLGGGLVAGWRLGGLVGAWWLGGGLVTWWGLGGFRNLVRLSTLVFLCSREPRLSSAQLRAE